MSIEPRKVWQVIRYVDNINSGEPSATQQQQHVQAIAEPPSSSSLLGDSHEEEEEEEDGYEEEDFEEDSYNHLIEEADGDDLERDEDEEEDDDEDDEDIISYDSESSFSRAHSPAPMESSTTVTRPMVLDLATGHTTISSSHHHELRADRHHHQLQVTSVPRLVYVKLGGGGGDSSTAGDHVTTVDRPMVDDLSRMLSANAMVHMAAGAGEPGHHQLNITTSPHAGAQPPPPQTTTTTGGATDEELTSLTWLQDKNLIQGT